MGTQHEVDEVEIGQQVDKLFEGVRARDLEAVRRLYATHVVSFDVEPATRFATLTLTLGNDVAFGHCFGRLSGTLKNGTATNGMWVRARFCFQKIDGAWLIVLHDHVSVPFDVASGRGVADLEP